MGGGASKAAPAANEMPAGGKPESKEEAQRKAAPQPAAAAAEGDQAPKDPPSSSPPPRQEDGGQQPQPQPQQEQPDDNPAPATPPPDPPAPAAAGEDVAKTPADAPATPAPEPAGADAAEQTPSGDDRTSPAAAAVRDDAGQEYIERLAAASARTHFVDVNEDVAARIAGQEREVEQTWRVGQELRIFCGTWNMGGAAAPEVEELREFLGVGQSATSAKHHVYAVASQECLRTINKSFLNSDKAPWEDALTMALGPRYTRIGCHTMVATHLMVFVREDVARHICEATIETACVTTGLVGKKLGNKGGVGLAFVLGPLDSKHSTSFLFLSAHFQAHQQQVEARNADYAHITEMMKLGSRGKALFRPPTAFAPRGMDDAGNGAGTPSPQRDVTDEYDCVFFMGDFNYRVVGARAPVEAMVFGEPSAMDACLRNDQLSMEMRKGRTFPGFAEGKIAFRPTYKYADGSDDYETKKMRIPSWTDRILYKQHPVVCEKRAHRGVTLKVQPYRYATIQELRHSDHRPVVGWYALHTPLPEAAALGGAKNPIVQESSTCAVM